MTAQPRPAALPAASLVGEVAAFIVRDRDPAVRYEVVGTRRIGFDIRDRVVADLPARSAHRALPHVILYRRGGLTEAQFIAAERLRRDIEAGGAWPAGAIDWARVEESLHIGRPGGAPRLSWPPRRPSARARRQPSGLGPTGGGDLSARRRVARLLSFVGLPGADLLLWVVGESRTCNEWTRIRNASFRAEGERLLRRAAACPQDDGETRRGYLLRAQGVAARRLSKQYAPDLLRDGLDAAFAFYQACGPDGKKSLPARNPRYIG
jgi:hypothetical protein